MVAEAGFHRPRRRQQQVSIDSFTDADFLISSRRIQKYAIVVCPQGDSAGCVHVGTLRLKLHLCDAREAISEVTIASPRPSHIVGAKHPLVANEIAAPAT